VDALRAWIELTRKEFYDGELCLTADGLDGVVLEKALRHPISLTHLCSKSPQSYRRSMQHIRANRVGYRVIWFVKSGWLKIARAGGVAMIQAGEAAILDSNVPFSASIGASESAGSSGHESYQAIVPPDIFLRHLYEAERFAGVLNLNTPEGRVVRRLLDFLVEDGDQLGPKTSSALVDGFLEAVAENLRANGQKLPQRQKLADRRLADIETYILMNLTDPELSTEKVAACCGVSARYLCYLLKANKTSFSDLLWKNRLLKTRDWLREPKARDYPIHEIAYLCGFKSAAHFSRMFKSAYGCTPSDYRLHGTPALALSETSTCARRCKTTSLKRRRFVVRGRSKNTSPLILSAGFAVREAGDVQGVKLRSRAPGRICRGSFAA